MHLNRRIRIQLAIFAAVALVAVTVMVFGYVKVPLMLGVGRYVVTVQLPQSAGLYATGNDSVPRSGGLRISRGSRVAINESS